MQAVNDSTPKKDTGSSLCTCGVGQKLSRGLITSKAVEACVECHCLFEGYLPVLP